MRTAPAALALVLLAALAGVARAAGPVAPAPRVVDAFESTSAWTAQPASGVLMKLSGDAGAHGRSLRIDFDFGKGGGYAVVHRALDLDLPDNYRFRFEVRGDCAPQNLEFKLIDASGENVWWVNTRDFAFARDWKTVTIKRRHLSFAWGPAGGGTLRHVAALEFAVTAGSGGKGTVWLDDLTLEPLPPPVEPPPAPVASASSWDAGHEAARAADADTATWWESRPRPGPAWLELDLGVEREFGGLTIDWAPGLHAVDYDVEAADARGRWRTLRAVRGGNGGLDPLDLPESEARRLRIRVLRAAERSLAPSGVTSVGELIDPVGRLRTLREAARVGIREVTVEPLAWGATPTAFFANVARAAPRGRYPRGLWGEQSYWTVVGVDGDRDEALLGEDGALESGKGQWSVEPFLFTGGRLVTWADVTTEQWLEQGDLPIPSVRWDGAPLELTVTAFADGAPGASQVVARYLVRNPGAERRRGTLYLALRPFQVNPPTQFLNSPGGVASIRTLAREGRSVRVDGTRGVTSYTAPSGFGALAFDQGDITDDLAADRLPAAQRVDDPSARASGALAYALDLGPGESRTIDLVVPLEGLPPALAPGFDENAPPPERVAQRLARASAAWRAQLDRVTVSLPDTAVMDALRAQIGWILVNRDGAAIQPGSRSYDRSWIRDGSLTCSALLRLGHADAVKAFLAWFAPFQYGDGKVPCCVDKRGADPVPEHDSHGEFVYLVAEYLRETGDRAFVETLWPHVRAAAAYLDTLRAQRRTAEWATPEKREYYGLLPPSISHEGYSAKPMHSYWDDLFALRGYKDAAWLAGTLGHDEDARWLGASRDTFAADLGASIRAAMRKHGIDYVPGCADLGDFDATSTTIALNPVQAGDAVVPHDALVRTFERYWTFFADRRDGRAAWDAFTPYEWRTVGAMARLGMRAQADSALTWLMGFRRPPGFQHWAEVVDHDARHPRFIGDMPHTWVGSDFVRSVLDMLAYERESDSTLVIGAGIPGAWMNGPGIVVRGLKTRWGELTCTLRRDRDTWEARVEAGDLRVPPGGIELAPPLLWSNEGGRRVVTRCVDGAGQPVIMDEEGAATVRTLPAVIRWTTHSYVGGPYR